MSAAWRKQAPLLAAALCLLLAARSGAAEAATAERTQLIHAAVEWLVKNQNADGGWGGRQTASLDWAAYTRGSLDAFEVASAALCVSALAASPEQTDASREAASRGIDFLLENHDIKRPNGFEHFGCWAHAYVLECLAEHLAAAPDDPRAERMRAVSARMVERLETFQALDGGWGYLSLEPPRTFRPSFTSMSFTTATCLVALARARDAGIAVPEAMVEKALRSVERCATPAGSFTYGEYWRRAPAQGINQPKGSACRTPACLLALDLWERPVAKDALRRALERLLEDDARLQIVALRRPVPHESHYSISGYFYLYGHAYAARLFERLPQSDRQRFAPLLERALLPCREPDGSFWDYPFFHFHKPYGTAYALLALSRISNA
ncbi:MAG: terpene cyclase/mutase family protein [Planctomycetes bacterium]|nr:terpene cyclase/mutase family protein [Planctomycetota bacterium]